LAFSQEQQPKPPGTLVDIGGRKLHLNCQGVGSPTVVVETGGGSFSMEWALVQAPVSKFTRICVYDRAGYAWSDRGAVDDGISEIVDDLHLLLSAAEIKPPYVLVGQSLGSLYARAYQRRFPEQVTGMVFVDGTHENDIRLVVNGQRTALSQITPEQVPRAHADYLKSVPTLKAGSAGAPPFDRLSPVQQAQRQWAFEKIVRDMGWLPNTVAAAESWREEFAALRAQRLSRDHVLGSLPLRVLERSKDTTEVWHRQQLELAALSSASKLITAEGSGHMIHLERPDLVAGAIQSVIAESRAKH